MDARPNMAVPTSGLNALGQIFERKFIQAWECFQTDRFEEANKISRELVADCRVGDLHRAGCHLILAHSPDDYVNHAEQALELFENLYPDEKFPPDDEQKKSQDELITMTRRVLEQAKTDAEMYAPSSHKKNQPQQVAVGERRLNSDGVRSILGARRQPTDMLMAFPAH